jgi:hypothetical protein
MIQHTFTQDSNHNQLKMKTYTNQVFEKQEDGSMKLIETIVVEVEDPKPEELLAQKEAELLKIYQEIQQMKQN